MKRNDWILIIATAIYSFLFYRQVAGINFLTFNFVLLICLCLKERQETLNLNWWMAAAGSIATAVCIAIYGNTFSVVINLISLSLLAAMSFSSRSSVILSLLYSWYSYFSSLIFMFIDYVERKKNADPQNSNGYSKKIALVIIPLAITLVFFFLYRSSNALFNDFAQKINLDFISWPWVRFTLCGFIVLYGFFYHRQIRAIATLDENAKSNIEPGDGKNLVLFGKEIQIIDEKFSGTVLFVLLNLLLLLVNYLDFNYMFVDGKLPEGVTYADFVHQGVGMVIVSIVIAISIVLFCFRGELNFFRENKLLKAFAYLWIIQNVIMVSLTAYRTGIYSEYALTYKRIGIYIYLGLTMIGLVTTLYKIAAVKSNNFLFRINGWLFYGVFVVLSFFNWDMVITKNNIDHPEESDICYLIQLSWSNLPSLVKMDYADSTMGMFEWGAIKGDCYPVSGNKLSAKLYDFMAEMQESDWRSWSFDRSRVYKELNEPECMAKITYIDLSNRYDIAPEILKPFQYINHLNLTSTQIENVDGVVIFQRLKNLNLSHNHLESIKGIEKLTMLEDLNLSGNSIQDYTPLFSIKNLKVLRFEGQINYNDVEELKKHLPGVTITY